MANTVETANKLFLDTGFLVALVVADDQYHDRALELADQIEGEERHVVTTRAVVAEIGDALASPGYRERAAKHIVALQRSPTVDIVPLTEELFLRGFELYRERQDKSWGITDCISFVVMRKRGLREALTTDSDFEQAGFNALLRD
jgi:predicted nucleic acid-binding protein